MQPMISKAVRIILKVIFLATCIFKRVDERNYRPASPSAFSSGNAPESDRKEVTGQLLNKI